MNQFVQANQQKLLEFSRNNGIAFLGIFGSCARDDDHDTSDVDMLVEFSKPISLLEHATIQLKLEALLERKVDLISRKYIHPTFEQYIKDDVVRIV